jgi:hypothetical protein
VTGLALAIALLLAPAPGDATLLDRRLARAEEELSLAESRAARGEGLDEAAIARARAILDGTGERWLESGLSPADATEEERTRAVTETLVRVRAAREEAQAAGAATAPPAAKADVVVEVLAERQFREHEEPEKVSLEEEAHVVESAWDRLGNWFDRLWSNKQDDQPSWFIDWLSSIFRPVLDLLGLAPWQAIGVIFLVVVCIVLALLAHRYLRGLGIPRAAPPVGGALDPLIADAMRHDADHFLAEGARLVARGELRAAVRAYYIGVLSALHHRRLLKLEPGLTNWEHMARLRSRPDLHAKVAPLTRTFDFAWYGRTAVDRERVLEIAKVLEELSGPETAAASSAPTAPAASTGGTP